MDPRLPSWVADDPMIKARVKILQEKEFQLAKNDEERSRCTANGIIKYWCSVEKYPCETKDALKSKDLRMLGNAAFSAYSPNLEKAVESYSMSILYAPPGSDQLPLSYANRSAVLFRAKYYKECLEDIERAFKTGYPNNLKPKLLIRQVMCTYALTGDVDLEKDEALMEARSLVENLPEANKMKKFVEDMVSNPEKITSIEREDEARQEYVPEIINEHPQIPGASDAIAVKYSKKYGRHIVATRDIKTGEVLILDKPYAAIVAHSMVSYICMHCLKKTWNSIPCDHCVHAAFCSDECKQAAWSEYHDVECKVLPTAVGSGLEHQTLMGLRITVKAIKEAGTLENLKNRLKELDALKESDADFPINPSSYDTIYMMKDHGERKSPEELIHWSYNSVELAYYLATKTEVFGEKLPRDLKVVKDSKWFPFVAGLLAKNMRICKTGANGIIVGNNGDVVEENTIATLVPLYSLLNHRCYDPVVIFHFNTKMAVITPHPIKKDEQIFTTYQEPYTFLSRKMRKELYQTEYHFTCDCLACKEDWSVHSSTSWKKQKLPPKVVNELLDGSEVIGEPKLTGFQGAEHLLPLNQQFCAGMDLLYPRVKKPCKEVDALMDGIINVYESLSSPRSRFGEKY